MKKLFFSIFLTISACVIVLGQNYIYKGNVKYQATGSWQFELNGHYWTSNPVFAVAKHANGGYLMISIEVPFKQDYIGGAITIFLRDGSVIKCIDRGVRDYVNNRSIALYNLTNNEIELLKQNRISEIRFSIKNRYQDTRSFTADNNKGISYFIMGPGDGKNYYDTDVEIKELFQ